MIGSGTVPVITWGSVIHPLDDNPDRAAAANMLQQVSRVAALLGIWSRGGQTPTDRAQLVALGFASNDVSRRMTASEAGTERLNTLKVMNVGAIHHSTEWLASNCLLRPAEDDPFVSGERLPLTGAMIEWLADLLWHIIVCDTGVPHSQAELAFYVNLRQPGGRERSPSRRSFARAQPGEHRASSNEDLSELIRRRLERGVSGCEEKLKIDWEQDKRLRLARTMAASLAGQWKMFEGGRGWPPVAIATSYDLVLERQLLDCLEKGEAFHILVPAMKDEELAWLWGTYRKSDVGMLRRQDMTSAEGRFLSWDWYESESKDARAPCGPVVVKLNGSPFLELGDDATEASVLGTPDEEPSPYGSDKHDPKVRLLCIFSEYDSLRSLMAFRRASEPVRGTFPPVTLPVRISQALDWSERSWLFLGDRFRDWIPRLRLLLNAQAKPSLTCTQDDERAGEDGIESQENGSREASGLSAGRVKDKIAIDRQFDWPERALLDALDMLWFIGDLVALVDYPNAEGGFFSDVRQLLPWQKEG